MAANPSIQSYIDLISKWYSVKPVTPRPFDYTAEQAATDRSSVGQEYRPFYQEQATQSGQDFTLALQNAREGFSRRGLWGAGGANQGVTTRTDPNTGLTYTVAPSGPEHVGGPVSGLRQVAETNLATKNDQANTAFGRAYTQAVAQGAQGRQAEAQDVYKKTVTDPYQEAYKTWLAQLGAVR